ncbi:MAG: signal peptide peptidase SppA [Bacteroidetes bacterium]|nr:signal peptide peptidase SppA [Bacteroidota bacterium]
MKQFFGAFLGSLIGILLTGVIVTLIIIGTIMSSLKGAMNDDENEAFKLKPNSVLLLNLNAGIKDRGFKNPFGKLNLGPFMKEGSVGLDDVLSMIKQAGNDKNIKGIYLETGSPTAGMATLEEIRQALLDFRKSGKFIYAYSEMYSQKGYYMATVADKLLMNPQGGMEFKGLSAQLMFYKNMLDKLNIEVQIFRHGKFKSAIEPFMLDKMSAANREQIETYIGSIWNTMLTGISAQRHIPVGDLNAIADNLKLNLPTDAVDLKLVDGLTYEDEAHDMVRKTLGIASGEKINFVKSETYLKHLDKKEIKLTNQDKIAVIYAVGEIESGEGNEETIGSDRIVKAIREARLDDHVKAIVFRVNSPGGSALASDVMWREVVLAKKAKPFIVSMGDVAASGGYYISCAADRIFAEPNTITGSIGVFGLIPNAQQALSEKLGITIDTANTNKHSDMGSILRKASPDEYNFIQKGVEHVYDVFTSRVADGRKMKQAQVDSIGQGRVWSGVDALRIHLVDELGGLQAAIGYAVKKAGLKQYRILDLPKQKDPLEELLNVGGDETEARVLSKNLGGQYIYLKHLKNVLSRKGVQARLPYEMIVE